MRKKKKKKKIKKKTIHLQLCLKFAKIIDSDITFFSYEG